MTRMTDELLDLIISRILQLGVLISALLVLAGGVWYLAGSAGVPQPFGHYQHGGGVRALLALPRSEVVILAGLLLLAATPVVRVAFSLFAFAVQKDWTYVAVTAVVLGVLLYSLLMGV
ncbi:MAG TPA: DUF1634 domain-containing protein [Bryobacteraceae bacterium]|jgi:uncharacterized membrane protein|nr:DUF1634 domain-containing protein [Bryobacteraceae bacterium]